VFYFRRAESATSSIYVNLWLADVRPTAGLTHAVRVKIRLISPRPDGLSGSAEASTLWEIEDALNAELTASELAGIFAGRITSGGHRELFFFIATAIGWTERVRAVMERYPLYEWTAGTQHDGE
jgi:hypothetical protein